MEKAAISFTESFFSSPEHKVLRVSYCDCAVSFVNFLPCVCCRVHTFHPMLMKLGQNGCLRTSFTSILKMGHVESKTKSLCQILEKPLHPVEATFSVQYS